MIESAMAIRIRKCQSDTWLKPILAVLCFALFYAPFLSAQTPKPSGDDWLRSNLPYPRAIGTNRVRYPAFESLKAEAIAGKLKFSFTDVAASTNRTAWVYTSMDEPSRQFSRDWRRIPMIARTNSYDTVFPVLQVDVPVVYFVALFSNAVPLSVSELRICRPRILGIEEPSKYFWPFLEGFEEGLDNWEWVNKPLGSTPLVCVGAAKNGENCLKLSLPTGTRSGAIGTSVVRSWHLVFMGGRGLRFWARTDKGEGKVQLSLLCHAGSTNQTILFSPKTYSFTHAWTKVEIPFVFLPVSSYASVDYCTLEFRSDTANHFFVDDFSLMGRWKMELE